MIGLHLLNAVGGATLLRNKPTRDKGRYPENFVSIATFPCRRPFAPGAAELMMASRLETKVTHITYTRPTEIIQRGDRIQIEGVEYDVTAILPPSKPHHLKILLEKRQYGAVES
jgi:hypothetical protein